MHGIGGKKTVSLFCCINDLPKFIKTSLFFIFVNNFAIKSLFAAELEEPKVGISGKGLIM